MSQNMIQPATSFLLDALKENKQEQGHLQTCLLTMNLVRAEVAKISTDHDIYEGALTIYQKYDQHVMAINVLIEHIVSNDRGLDYTNEVRSLEQTCESADGRSPN